MKVKKKRIILGAIILMIVAIIGIYLFIKYRTYESVEIIKSYENDSTDNANYKRCLDGILRYSRDGIALLTEKGKAVWNQPCQMSNPVVKMRGDSVAVGDQGGTSILVFQKKGLKGEVKTTRPIEKFTVSSQGIVSAILKDEEAPLVMCYDAMGNILVEHKVSLKNTGYPIDVSISEDGKTLLVSYLYTEGTKIITRIAYYYFGDDYTEKTDYLVHEQELHDMVVPVVTFLDKNTSLLVADHALIFCEGLKEPEEAVRVEITKEVQGVAYNDKLVAVIVNGGDESEYKLHIYNVKGKLQASVDVDREYTGIQVMDNQVVLFEGQSCSIFMKNGVHKFTGKVDENIMEMFPIGGLNKYMMINASGFHEIQLVR